jgi:hypothetical protein
MGRPTTRTPEEQKLHKLQYDREYHAANRERVNAKQREKYRLDRKHYQAKAKRSAQKNAAHIAAYQKEYREKNRIG